MNKLIYMALLCAAGAWGSTTNALVQVALDGTRTIPPNTIALPSQVAELGDNAATVNAAAINLEARATECVNKVRLYGSNYVVTSTVYVQSIGGVPYDPSNQTVTVYSLSVSETDVTIIGYVAQTPLVRPVLDWRAALNAGVWSNATATVAEVDIPAGVTAAKAYSFTLPRPGDGTSAHFRIVDNSTGASGSGLWWVVFGGINVDGKPGYTGDIVVTVDGQQILLPYHGGILTTPTPTGGL